ncbi:hypothetical protein RvY_17828 [Ramazzottius varieornatus]|uniref:Uncharacterized protein n=1 Tax=Ramazzottius varieornatus TaxID=947166 RepID=A0A1D1W5J9_RAMVA|nr:hypothetical protein RvY_17828 [Ramazzottius varieornatus]
MQVGHRLITIESSKSMLRNRQVQAVRAVACDLHYGLEHSLQILASSTNRSNYRRITELLDTVDGTVPVFHVLETTYPNSGSQVQLST